MYSETGTSNTMQFFFQVRHSRCVEYKLKYNIKIYNIIIKTYIFLIMLDRNCSYMIRPNCRAIFRLIFEQLECTVDNT